jgi:hypothetical protein
MSSDSFERALRDSVRTELATLIETFGQTLDHPPSEISREELAGRALARIRRRDGSRVGRLGERVARVPAGKRRIPSMTGTARFRVPDVLSDSELIEVKNVARLTLTPQLTDFLVFAEASGLKMVLLTRFDTVLSPELRALIQAGRIEHRELTGLLSATGRRVIRRMIDEVLTNRSNG